MPTRFEEPSTPARTVSQPRLASWNRTGDPDQVRLAAYLDEVEAAVGSAPPSSGGAMALELKVGLPSGTPLTVDRDLDNYLLPIANRLKHYRFAAVFGAKAIAPDSSIRVGPTRPQPDSPPPQLSLRATGSYERAEWKHQIARACAAARPDIPPDVPIAMHIAYELAPNRNWTALWKPTIDALGPLLGAPNTNKPYAPNDGRIVQLGLHRIADSLIGHDVRIAIWWQAPGQGELTQNLKTRQ